MVTFITSTNDCRSSKLNGNLDSPSLSYKGAIQGLNLHSIHCFFTDYERCNVIKLGLKILLCRIIFTSKVNLFLIFLLTIFCAVQHLDCALHKIRNIGETQKWKN